MGINVPGQYRQFNFLSDTIEIEKTGNADWPYIVSLKGDGGTETTKISEMVFRITVAGGYYKDWLGDVFLRMNSEPQNVGPFPGHGVVKSTEETSNIEMIYKNMFVEISKSSISRFDIPKDISYDERPRFITNGYSVSTFFKIMQKGFVVNSDGDIVANQAADTGHDSYIRVRLKDEDDNYINGINELTESIRYWYFDFDDAYHKNYGKNYVVNERKYDYVPEKSQYHFVFGVNLTAEDHQRGYVDIYITKTTHRDERVFDSVGRQIGYLHNCVDETGDYFIPKYKQYDENDDTTMSIRTIEVQVEPENSGIVDGAGSYYDGELAQLVFTPNEGNIFYRWKQGNEVVGTNNVLTKIVQNNKTFIAQCGVKYNFWDSELGNGVQSGDNTTDSFVLYQFNSEQVDGDILEISAKIRILASGYAFIPSGVYQGDFKIDTSKHVSEQTSARADISLDAGSIILNVWFDNNTKTIYANGYRNLVFRKTKIGVEIVKLDVVLVGQPTQTILNLVFSEGIESIVVKNVTKNTQTTYSSDTDKVVGNDYNDEIKVWAVVSDGYVVDNNEDKPLTFTMKYNMWFVPEAVETETIKLYQPTVPKSSISSGVLKISARNMNNVPCNLNVSLYDDMGNFVTALTTSTEVPKYSRSDAIVYETDKTSLRAFIRCAKENYLPSDYISTDIGQEIDRWPDDFDYDNIQWSNPEDDDIVQLQSPSIAQKSLTHDNSTGKCTLSLTIYNPNNVKCAVNMALYDEMGNWITSSATIPIADAKKNTLMVPYVTEKSSIRAFIKFSANGYLESDYITVDIGQEIDRWPDDFDYNNIRWS